MTGFVSLLTHTGDFAGKPFELLPWEEEVLDAVYGTVGEGGLRRYQYAYLELPKKNGKTELVAALAIYHLVNDGPLGEIYCCAAEKQQAALVYKAAKAMVEANAFLKRMLKIKDSAKEMQNRETGTFVRCSRPRRTPSTA